MDDGAGLPAPATWWRVGLRRRSQFATESALLQEQTWRGRWVLSLNDPVRTWTGWWRWLPPPGTRGCCIEQITLYCPRGIPTHVVVPSVSRAAEVHGLAGTIFVEMPSSAGLDKPVRENVWFSAEEIPCTAAGATGADCPIAGGEGELAVPLGGVPMVSTLPAFPLGATPPAAGPRAAGVTPETLH
jgi:hypothetical protein